MPLLAGAAVADITPLTPTFLYGYPRVPRIHTGVHDPLLASALYLESDGVGVLFIANDILWIAKATAAAVRQRIASQTGLPVANIVISCTHTHSGPNTLDALVAEADPVVPKVEPAYVKRWEDQMVAAGLGAWRTRREATLSHATADATGIGTNRHDPKGPSDLSIPILYAREAASGLPIAVMLVCCMHPTVLHEDSKLVSGDFPADARAYLQTHGFDCPIVYHIGAAGDQSPRHATRGNTFAEAERLGQILGRAVEKAMKDATSIESPRLALKQATMELPLRTFPPVTEAEKAAAAATRRFESLRDGNAPRTATRTAECDMFGADETVVLARAAASGRLAEFSRSFLPAEIQVIAIGPLRYVAWPGEWFVAFGLRIKRQFPTAAVITLANGDLQAYVVTQEAVDQNWYEAGNALVKSPDAGNLMVDRTLDLLKQLA